MTKRWIACAVLISLAGLMMTGCTGPWFKKKPKTSTPTYPGGGIEQIGTTDLTGTSLPNESTLSSRENVAGKAAVAATLDSVMFDYDSAQVADTERGKVEAAAALLNQTPNASIVVEGNCDERGSNEYNLTLGERRALAVRAYLMSLGLDGARIQTRSYGEERPKNPGHDEAAWRENRRVDFVTVQ